MTPQEQIEIIQAYDRGEEIEYKCKFDRYGTYSWIKVQAFNKKHQFNFNDYVYRVKPQPKRWRADVGCNYFCINGFGGINQITQIDGDSDAQLYKIGNYFRTQETAEKARELMKDVLNKFKDDDD